MQQESSSSHGIKWGVIIGLVYCLLLFARFAIGEKNPAMFTLLMFVGFIAVVVLLFFCGRSFRKMRGGYLEMKEAFKVMFIAVLILELFYAVFTIIYLKYINPAFFDNFRLSTETILTSFKQPQADVDKALDAIDQWADGAKNMNVMDFLKTYLSNVAAMGLFALIFSFILKRKQPVFTQDNF